MFSNFDSFKGGDGSLVSNFEFRIMNEDTLILQDGKTLCLMADRFAAGLGYLPMVTDKPGEADFRVLDPGEYDMGGLKKRHGGVLRITEEEVLRLETFFA